MVKMKVIKSHRGDNRTPIMKSLYQIIESKKPNIKGSRERISSFLMTSLMEKWDIKYPYILPLPSQLLQPTSPLPSQYSQLSVISPSPKQ